MREILSGSGGPIRDAVVLNSGAALVAGDMADSLAEGIDMAAASIADGRAAGKLDAMVTLTRELSPPED
jgi:anthranilate phosphoribosyltransferase